MAETEERGTAKDDLWRARIAEQERSGLSVKQFCQERGLTQYSFYAWRKRLRPNEPVRFALVDRGVAPQEPPQEPATEAGLELVLTSGERLRIGIGVDSTTLRTVLEVLRT